MTFQTEDLKKLTPEAREAVWEELRKREAHWRQQYESSNGIKPDFFQSQLSYEAVELGKNVLFAGATGSGKTYATFNVKNSLERKMGREARVCVFTPEQAWRTAFTDGEELSDYTKSLGLGRQRMFTLSSRTRLSRLRNGYDFLGLNYHQFGFIDPRKGISNPYFDFIMELVRNRDARPDIFIVDEVQNLKTPGSNTTLWFEKLREATEGSDIEWILLSAYPVPNKLEDAGVLLHFLDPRFPLAKYDYRTNPQAISHMRMQGKWLTFTREDLKRLYNLPDLIDQQIPELKDGQIADDRRLEMDDKHVQEYIEVWRNGDMPLYRKMHKMRQICIDSTYSWLRELAGDAFYQDKNAQVLIFSDLKTGIFDRLQDILAPISPYGMRIVHGKTPFRQRVETGRDFREGKISLLVCTEGTMGEGIPLNTQNVLHEFVIEPTPVPGVHNQLGGRGYRRNTVAPVYLSSLVPWSHHLSELMLSSRPELEEKYNVTFNPSWTQTTTSQDYIAMRQGKERIYNSKATRGHQLTDLEESLMNTDEKNIGDAEHAVHMTGIPPISPEQIRRQVMTSLIKHVGLYGAGAKDIQEATEGEGEYAIPQEMLVRAYSHVDRFLPYVKIARLIKATVDYLEGNGKRFEKILDVGCGQGVIAYELSKDEKRPVINFDIDHRMLHFAQRLLKDREGMEFVHGNMASLPFGNESLDLIIASNSLMYLAQRYDKGMFRREVEEAIMRFNNVLKPGGYLVVTLPHAQTTEEMFERFNGILPEYGLRVDFDDYLRMYAMRTLDKKDLVQRVYLTIAEKERTVGRLTPESDFVMYKPSDYIFVGGSKRYYMGEMMNRNSDASKLIIVGKKSGLTDFQPS